MSKLTGGEPRHWHDSRGRHKMADPQEFLRETNRVYWSRDEREYADHLEEHRGLSQEPEPRPDDGPQVTALFEHIESLEAIVAKERQLIIALRQKAQQAPEEGD